MQKLVDDEFLVDCGAILLGLIIIAILTIIIGIAVFNSQPLIITGIIGLIVGFSSISTIIVIHHKLWTLDE